MDRYHLHSFKIVFVSKLRPNLQNTIANLQKSLPYVTFPVDEKNDFLHVYPKRLPRRMWKITYLKSPFK